ncbi:MAG: branched-chain amino acid aminotransferase [Streptosporangiales bacterium]|nr:branched-chain amino acid aminotransferase [Streptosporangiales bacterium]
MTTTAHGPIPIELKPTSRPMPSAEREAVLAAPGFGQHFTDHMVVIDWEPDRGWFDGELRPYGPLQTDPATSVLHYAQSIFEGYKAYRQPDGSIATFRPDANGRRMQRSAQRMALPELPVETFVAAGDALVRTDSDWVPREQGKSLYLRPFMYASEVFLGVRPARHVTFCVIASPAASYFSGGVKPVSIWVSEEYSRAAPGGTGGAKCAGNYAASLIAQQEAIENGCEQVVFLDAVERRWVEELGGMNIFFVRADGSLVTPPTSGSILAGITRDSVIELAKAAGRRVEERPVSLDEWRDSVASGAFTEVFACGTAAVLTPIGRLSWRGGEIDCAASGEEGPVTHELRETLVGIQTGTVSDDHGWLHRVS